MPIKMAYVAESYEIHSNDGKIEIPVIASNST